MIITALKQRFITPKDPQKATTKPYSPFHGDALKLQTPLTQDVVTFSANPVTKAPKIKIKLKTSTVQALHGTLANNFKTILSKIKPYQPVIGTQGLKKINKAFTEALNSRIFNKSAEDVEFILEKDPALKSKNEKEALLYKSVAITFVHRVANDFYKKGETTIARAISEASKELTGAEIHPGATIGRYVFIDHPSGLVVGESTKIGDRFHGHGNVLLGSDGINAGKQRHPQIGDNVTIWPKANVHGNKKIGDNSIIGCEAVITENVPENAKVIGRNQLIELDGKKISSSLKDYWESQKPLTIA